MQRWLLQANICLSLLILLSGSQQDKVSWAPPMTLVMLLSWGLTGASLILFHGARLLENRPRMILYPLPFWIPFMIALQTSLAEAILILPLSTTAAMLYLTTRHSRPENETPRLPGPVTESGRRRLRRFRRRRPRH
ncbi:uncharacterized protein TrAtP1_005633 [Trichoderma atroviride]|uniref:uncharacterized protein n=1 Tax=Hypocrea atroviridis TaxID=63577 RepID=UPI0033337EAF|nr:hypothetical protein TrAtP1_005633 [Trichoderma atroviride]